MFIDLNIHSFECSEFNFELELVEIRRVYTWEELSEFAKINAMSWDPIDVRESFLRNSPSVVGWDFVI